MENVRRLPVGEDNEAGVSLDELAREGARRMIAAALEAEVDEYVSAFVDEVGEDGRRLVVRNGRARERKLTVGSGTVPIRGPRVNDKRVDAATGERQKFSSKILPAYARRSPKVTEVLPVLYLHGLSTGDFEPALRDLLGEDASGLSPASISRLTKAWQAEHEQFRTRSLRFHRYAYLFVDGVHVSVRLGEDDRLCLLVVIGVREDGVKELLAVEDGYRESTDSWAAVLRDLRDRGLTEPRLVTGDGALGAWAALRDVFPAACEQRCWVHKIANVLDALPKRLQPRAKTLLHQMMEAPTEADARAARETFREEFAAKYPRRRQARPRLAPALRVLRVPRRALAPSEDDQPDRVELRHRQAAHARDQGRRLEGRGARDGVQAAQDGGGALAALQRPRARRRCPRRREVQGRDPGPRRAPDARREGRRLIVFTPTSSTTLDNCSPPAKCRLRSS
jgi:putative transposase